jgi:hypothetical protein
MFILYLAFTLTDGLGCEQWRSCKENCSFVGLFLLKYNAIQSGGFLQRSKELDSISRVNIYQNIRGHIPDDTNLHPHCRKDLSS